MRVHGKVVLHAGIEPLRQNLRVRARVFVCVRVLCRGKPALRERERKGQGQWLVPLPARLPAHAMCEPR